MIRKPLLSVMVVKEVTLLQYERSISSKLAMFSKPMIPALFTDVLEASTPSWQTDVQLPLRCSAKTRYRQTDEPCIVNAIVGRHGQARLRVTFDTPQRAVTPGQSVVFYADRQCLGGAVID